MRQKYPDFRLVTKLSNRKFEALRCLRILPGQIGQASVDTETQTNSRFDIDTLVEQDGLRDA
ncbi:MAG TPA: hypothetical protein DIC52_16200 [Candidatus Latescibacteria bacterium]|jgi:hypothetical protein|nr:hypothetical protein [Candidatus Latescibacterota bacterium]